MLFYRQISKALCILNPERVQSPEEDPQEMEEALETITDFADSIDTSNGMKRDLFFTKVVVSCQVLENIVSFQTFT